MKFVRVVELKLTKWGIEQPLEFWKLLQICIDINDDQILEDIFAVAYGISVRVVYLYDIDDCS